MPYGFELLNRVNDADRLDGLIRINLLCLAEEDGRRLALPDGNGVFVLKGATGRRQTLLLHAFDDDLAYADEILMGLVDDAGIPLAYKDAERDGDFADLSAFAAWIDAMDIDESSAQLTTMREAIQNAL